MTGWSSVATYLSLKAILSRSWRESCGNVGTFSFALLKTSYEPSDILAYTRIHLSLAIMAASSAHRFQSSILPSGPGRRTGQRKTTPRVLTAVKMARGPKVASVDISDQRAG